MAFLAPVLLAGLAAVAIPPVIHFFQRRRYVEVDWGAMQFLELGQKAKRKLLLEQWLLLAVRMAVLAVLAAALAGPVLTTPLLARFDDRPPRDTVLLLDTSASTGTKVDGTTAADRAAAWASSFLADVRAGDRVWVCAVRGGGLHPLTPGLTADPEQARAALELRPDPRGSADWPAAVDAALKQAPGAEVVALTDGQRFGWADADALARWDLLARRVAAEGRSLPQVWVAVVSPPPPADGPNAALDPITTNRAVATAGAEVRFRAQARRTGVPGRVRLAIDGRAAGEVAPPPGSESAGVVPLSFTRRFAAGSHLVTLQLDPDDRPGDNRQDFALEVVPAVPVLIVDGDPNPAGKSAGADFLRDALAPPRDPTPGFIVRSVGLSQFTPQVLAENVRGESTPPRVLVLADPPALTPAQTAAVERFAQAGNGVLVTHGDRAEAAAWNRAAWRQGRGWLPARLLEIADEPDPEVAPRPNVSAFRHPALDLFRDPLPGGLHAAVFPRRWRLEADPAAVAGALTTGEPLFAEKAVGRGRVVQCAVPLDNRGRTNVVTLPDFVRLAHELAYHLAGAGGGGSNLAPGEPIVFQPADVRPPGPVTVQPPDGPARVVPVSAWPLVYDATHDPGAYAVTAGGGPPRYFAVRPDPRESDPAPLTDADRAALRERLGPVEFVATPEELRDRRGRGAASHDLSGLLLAVLMALLMVEVWYTRRAARQSA